MIDLPSSAQTAYAELLDSLLGTPAPRRGVSYFTRTVDSRDYWYVQQVVGERKRSFYLGPDDDATRDLVDRAKRRLEEDGVDRPTRARLVATCQAAGLWFPTPAETRVYEAIAQSGLFAMGGTLVGTHAFMSLGNLLGVRWDPSTSRTEDLDIAHDPALQVAIDDHRESLLEALRQREPDFLPIPSFERGKVETSFKIRGRRTTVSVLTPLRGRPQSEPVPIPALNTAAEPVRFLDFLTEKTLIAALPAANGILIRVPDPARFALHKLVVSQRRPAAMAAKSRKDIAQARELLGALNVTRPGDIEAARDAAASMPDGFGRDLARGEGILVS